MIMKNKTELYKQNGEMAGLYDICRWWIETYPEDIFVANPETIVIIRKQMQLILDKKKGVD
jgi:hypothetical protein